ncbi:hypothetical protein TorRG33x02_150080 [Trema orientale]|uniref:Uncharacterized protein n=1 Tax=Trema orientale TaxID=63057 RepID=A0A2P5EUF0_TREOI|nr:hypothetical protein TorRG33x02_150080 [Trema orientale]
MSSPLPGNIHLGALCKYLVISGLLLTFFYIVLFDTTHHHYQPSDLLETFKQKCSNIPLTINTSSTTPPPDHSPPPTNISHLVFGVIGSMNTWRHKRFYSQAWWRPNVTRGYVFLDRAPTTEFLPWSSSSPPFRVNENITMREIYPKLASPIQIRMVRTSLETFREGDEDVRWYVIADDDTVLMVDNLVEILKKYDHTKYYYIGTNSESLNSDFGLSFDMAFGGAAYVLSYPVAKMIASTLDSCIERYPGIGFSDLMMYTCLTDLGVAITHNKGFHQIDLRGDISGLLSAHPQTPFISLHHIDTIDPIFPRMNRPESINHLMKAAKVDQSRALQQTTCHHRATNWTLSVAWGYSAQIYEAILPRSFLRKPLETFRSWSGGRPPYLLNPRWRTNNPCEAPHVFFFHSVSKEPPTHQEGDHGVITTYVRASSRGLPSCSPSGNHSADRIDTIRVFSPAKLPLEAGRRECCDVVYAAGMNSTEVRYRACMNEEVTA